MAKKIGAHVRRAVRLRASAVCEYCLSPEAFSTYTFSIDHIIPSAQGGTDDLENLALACQGCNGSKYNKTEAPDPVTNKPAPLYNPRTNVWDEHFYWSEDFLEIIGKTAIGRATVEAMQLNRWKLINLRRGLYQNWGTPRPEINVGKSFSVME